MNFSNAITRQPADSYPQGITSSNLGKPDLTQALKQHADYVNALQHAGLQVSVLPPNPDYPDSVFVEDAAVVTREFAVISRPGAESRRGEIDDLQPILAEGFENLYHINAPGTLDGGDICQVERHFLIGISERTNPEGAGQLAEILDQHGYSSESIDIRSQRGILHLKSAVNYLGDDTLLVDVRMADHPALKDYTRFVVPLTEAYAANCLLVNQVVLVPDGFPRTLELIQSAGYKAVILQVSEYQKMDGGLSCLSLRW
jgi:dimethylargininase